MKDVLVAGAGNIGRAIAALLSETGDYRVTVADGDAAALQALWSDGVSTHQCDLTDDDALKAALIDKFAVVAATPYDVTPAVARAAIAAGAHYFDLTEDEAASRVLRDLEPDARAVLAPQCGLAPGFISIAAGALAARFETLNTMTLRVGALPQTPTNALGYNLTWSTDGLINEYVHPCEVIANGAMAFAAPLEGLENLVINGVAYEAFHTSGGLGSLGESLKGRIRELAYKTIRYPGHRDAMRMLIHDLGLKERRSLLKEVLEGGLATTVDDVVLVQVTVTGQKDNRFTEESFVREIYPQPIGDRVLTAIQATTAGSACAILDLVASGALPQSGLIRQENVPLEAFLENRFGRVFQAR